MQTYLKVDDRLVTIGNDRLHVKGDIVIFDGKGYIVGGVRTDYNTIGNHKHARCESVVYELIENKRIF